MIKNITYYFLIFTLLYSCSERKETSYSTITGNIPKLSGEIIYLEELDIKTKKLIDSTKINEEGGYIFNVEIDDAGFYILRSDEDNYLLLLIDKNEDVEIEMSNDTLFLASSIKGSPGSKLLLAFEIFMSKQKQRIDSLAEVFYTNQGNPEFYETKIKLDSIYELVYDDQKNYSKEFIDKNSGSLASLIVINRKLGSNTVLEEENDYEYFYKTDSVLYIKYPENKHVVDHHQRVAEIKARVYDKFMADRKLKPGNKAPNIVLKDTSGNFITLKDIHDKKVLLFFWAAWNAKSRQDNKKLLTLYDELQKKNIEIFSVSLDDHEKLWKGAIKLDKLPWLQGSDLMGWKSPVNKKYNLNNEIPFYCFVDSDKKIIFKGKNVDLVIQKLKE